jgi:AP-2 complex subunit alpha
MATTGMRGLNIFIQDIRNAPNKEAEQARVDKELANIRKKFKKIRDMTAYDRKKCVHVPPRTRRARRGNPSRARGGADPRSGPATRASARSNAPRANEQKSRSRATCTLQTRATTSPSESPTPDPTFPARPLAPSASRYVWKLLYIFMLGYEVDFGHMQVVGLISAPKYAEKQVGYTVTSVLLNETHDFLRLVINSVREDIISRSETFQCLGLSLVANVGGREFADSLAADVQRVLCSNVIRPIVRKKAALALLRLYRRNRDILTPETFSQRMLDLLDERDLGILTGVLSLLTGIVAHDHRGYESCIPKICEVMQRLARNKDIPTDYLYYQLPSPWLQVKCMRVLQYFPTPEDPDYLRGEMDVIHQILKGTDMVKNVNKNNALHAVLFEAVQLATMLDVSDKSLLAESVATLGRFIELNEPNIVYLGLNHLAAMIAPDTLDAIKAYQPQVVARLHDADISIRKRALDLLYNMCDASNAREIVGHLLRYLTTADFNIREELALKTAILAERYSDAPGGKAWFLEVAMTLVEKAGDFISDKLWHRVVQVVTNAKELHAPAARTALAKLREGASHEMFVRVSAYFLGEFGRELGPAEPPVGYATLLLEHYKSSASSTRQIILSALAKIAMHAGSDANLRARLGELFRANAVHEVVELQQRSAEYFVMTSVGANATRLKSVLDPMPDFPERASALEKTVEENVGESADAAAARKARTQGGALPVTTPTRPAADPTTPASVAQVPTVGLEDLLGGAPAPVVTSAPTQVPTPNATTAAGALEDLLGTPSAPAPAASAPAASAGALVDGFGGGAAAAAAAAAAAPSAAPVVNVADCLKKLRASDNGLLYEDPNLQIGVKSQWQGNQGRVMFYLGNKTDGDVSGVSLELHPAAGLNARLAPVPQVVAAKKQLQVLLELAVASGYAGAPAVTLRYVAPGGVPSTTRLELPYGCHKFLQPWSVSDNREFFAKWHELTKRAQDVKVVTVAPGIAAGGLAAVEAALTSVRMGVMRGVDPNANNAVAGSKIGYSAMGETFVLARVESDANNEAVFRITIASGDMETVKGVQAALFSQILP